MGEAVRDGSPQVTVGWQTRRSCYWILVRFPLAQVSPTTIRP